MENPTRPPTHTHPPTPTHPPTQPPSPIPHPELREWMTGRREIVLEDIFLGAFQCLETRIECRPKAHKFFLQGFSAAGQLGISGHACARPVERAIHAEAHGVNNQLNGRSADSLKT